MTPLAVVLATIVVMEPAVALTHRFVMHGAGWAWHRSHHQPPRAMLEANDLFPVAFAAATVGVMAVGSSVTGLGLLLWFGVGVSAYGAAYLVVHDICIHGRLGRSVLVGPYLRWVAASHAVHHRYGREPYGFLVPIVPAARRERGQASGREAGRGTGRAAEATTVPILRAVDRRARRVNTS
jgi:beta-carotene 3-hydroxylase